MKNKQLIMMNINTRFTNKNLTAGSNLYNRVITERNFDPDEDYSKKGILHNHKCVFSYFSDLIEINIIRNKNNTYMIMIEGCKANKAHGYLKTASEAITVDNKINAFYRCYIKARETALEIIRAVEDCEIYGYMADFSKLDKYEKQYSREQNLSKLRFYDNCDLIDVLSLQRIM